jgi:hypothetical protein
MPASTRGRNSTVTSMAAERTTSSSHSRKAPRARSIRARKVTNNGTGAVTTTEEGRARAPRPPRNRDTPGPAPVATVALMASTAADASRTSSTAVAPSRRATGSCTSATRIRWPASWRTMPWITETERRGTTTAAPRATIVR